MHRPLLALAALSATIAGCAELPIAAGPSYSVAPCSALDITAVMPVEIRDARPAWERQYHAPHRKPEGYRRAIGLIPLENFTPSVRDQIRTLIEQHAAALRPVPTWGELEIRSFRVVLNNTEKLQLRYEEMLEAERRNGRWNFAVSDSGGVSVGVGFGVGHDRFHTPVGFGPAPFPPPPPPATFEQTRRSMIAAGERKLIGPPDELPMRYGQGVTCEIEAAVTLHFSDGRSETRELNVMHHAPPQDVLVYESENDVPKTVEGALADFAAQLASTAPAATAE